MAVAAEEMTANVIKHGGENSEWIDVCLNIEPDTLRFRIRDNGIPFDPTEYQPSEDQYITNGIEIVKRIASKISYVRVIDLNNTVIEVKNSETGE